MTYRTYDITLSITRGRYRLRNNSVRLLLHRASYASGLSHLAKYFNVPILQLPSLSFVHIDRHSASLYLGDRSENSSHKFNPSLSPAAILYKTTPIKNQSFLSSARASDNNSNRVAASVSNSVMFLFASNGLSCLKREQL